MQHKLSESASTLLQSFTFTDLPSSMVRLAEGLLLMSIVVGLPTYEINHSDQYVYKPFWMNSRKPVFPPQLKQQETVFKVISSFREYIDLRIIYLLYILCRSRHLFPSKCLKLWWAINFLLVFATSTVRILF